MGHVPDVSRAGVHVLVVHGGEYGGKFLAGVQSGDGGSGTVLNGGGNAVQIIQIVQHQQLHFHNGSLFLAQLDLCLFKQGSQLLLGGYHSGIKLGLLDGGIAGGDRQGALGFAVDHGGTDGYTGKYRKTNTSFHFVLLTYPAQ